MNILVHSMPMVCVGIDTILNFRDLYFVPHENKILPEETRNLESGLLTLKKIHYRLVNNKAQTISVVDEFYLLIE